MAHLDHNLVYQFRMPVAELNRMFWKWGAGSLAGLAAAHFLLRNGIGGGTVILVIGIGMIGYFYGKQHVWLTLSSDGICGTGYTNRKIQISWRDTISISAVRKSDMNGVEIRKSENEGFVEKRVLSLFIPRAISDTPEFSAALCQLAPTDHPLRTLSRNASSS